MTISTNGTNLYWKAGEEMVLQVTETFRTETWSNNRVVHVIGQYVAKHLESGKPAQYCPGRQTCLLCIGGSKPKTFYQTKAIFDGKEYFVELTPMIAYSIANTQKMASEMGMKNLQSIKYRIKKLGNIRPYWEIVPIMPEGTSAATPDKGVVDLGGAVEETTALSPLTTEEVEYLKKFENAIKDTKKTNPDLKVLESIDEALKKRPGWTPAKREAAKKFYDAEGNFKIVEELVTPSPTN